VPALIGARAPDLVLNDPLSTSRRLAYVLRHAPQSIGLELDEAGWGDVAVVCAGLGLTPAALEALVHGDDKGRYTLSADRTRVRAEQGHSVPVALGHPEVTPPALLYHGTVERFVPAILAEGLRPRARHHVHLSADIEAARRVGARRGDPVVLVVDAARLASDGARVLRSGNGVWLVDAVPPAYLRRHDG
jgi:putative RNA 2'-phosphotransferase